MTENLQHWRCPECGRLYSSPPSDDVGWCDHVGHFWSAPTDHRHDLERYGWTAMKRLYEQYYVCHAPPWPDPLYVPERERAEQLVSEFADKGARLLVRIQADWWDDGGSR